MGAKQVMMNKVNSIRTGMLQIFHIQHPKLGPF